jgi:hypothetical protein
MSHLFMDLNASENGAGDEGESVYGEKADLRPGLGIYELISRLDIPRWSIQWCRTIVVVVAIAFR